VVGAPDEGDKSTDWVNVVGRGASSPSGNESYKQLSFILDRGRQRLYVPVSN